MDPFTAVQIGGMALSAIGSMRKQPTGLDLGQLRKDAKRNGFNPLTVLRMTGGAGYSRTASPSPLSAIGGFMSGIGNVMRQNQLDAIDNSEAASRNALRDAQIKELNSVPVPSAGRIAAPTPAPAPSPVLDRIFNPLESTPDMPLDSANIEVLPYQVDQQVVTQPHLTDSGIIVDIPVGKEIDEIVSGYVTNRVAEVQFLRDQFVIDPVRMMDSLSTTYGSNRPSGGPLVTFFDWMSPRVDLSTVRMR